MITSGTIVIEDGLKATEEYAPARKVRVELSFDYDDLDRVAVIAQVKVSEMLGKSFGAAPKTVQGAETAVGEAKKAPRKPATPATKPVETLPAVEDFPLGDEAKAQPAGQADEAGLDDGILGTEAPKVDVSDAALYKLVVEINAKIKRPKDITKLITEHCPEDGVPASLKRIPEDKRVEFINKVKAFAASVAK